MVSEKKGKNSSLSVVVRKTGLTIIKMKPELPAGGFSKKKNGHLSPPSNQFNSGYIKAKKHDPL
jgi:hypothetical protein